MIKNKTRCSLIDLLVMVAILLIILAILDGGPKGGFMNTSPGTGEKIGQVVKISKLGMVRETWEGQLIRGGMSGGSGSFGTVPFDFTVEDEELVGKVRQYMQDQTEVVIKYRVEGVYSPFRSESHGNFLVSIEPSKR